MTSQPKLNPPYRAEHLGSLLRPPYLLSARAQSDIGKVSQEELKSLEDRAIKEAVDMQLEVGMKVITDGEYRRHMFYDGFFDNLEGFTCEYYSVLLLLLLWRLIHIEFNGDRCGKSPIRYLQGICLSRSTVLSANVVAVRIVSSSSIKTPNLYNRIYRYVPDIAAFTAKHTKPASTTLCTGKIKHVKSGYVPQFEALVKIAGEENRERIKITLAAPEWYVPVIFELWL